MMHPDSSHWYTGKGQEVINTKWNTGNLNEIFIKHKINII